MILNIFHHYVTGLLLITATLFSTQALAKSPVYTAFFNDLAVEGYDTVAYFSDNKPVKGNSKYSTEYKGAEWHFSSMENLEKFKTAPEKYAPQYGGYCAWAVAQNNTAKGDPQQWTIFEDKLYLNYNTDIKNKWLVDKEGLISKADKHWPTLIE